MKESSFAVPDAVTAPIDGTTSVPSRAGKSGTRGGRGGRGGFGKDEPFVISGPVAGPFSQGPAPRQTNASGIPRNGFSQGNSHAVSSFSNNIKSELKEPSSLSFKGTDSDEDNNFEELSALNLQSICSIETHAQCAFYLQMPRFIWNVIHEPGVPHSAKIVKIGKCRIYKSGRMVMLLGDSLPVQLEQIPNPIGKMYEEFGHFVPPQEPRMKAEDEPAMKLEGEPEMKAEMDVESTLRVPRWQLVAPNETHYLMRL